MTNCLLDRREIDPEPLSPEAQFRSALAIWQRVSEVPPLVPFKRYDWVYLELPDLDAGQYTDDLSGEWTRGLLIRRVAMKLAQRRIPDAHTLTWSLWRRAHRAHARRAHLKRKIQL